MADRTNGVNNIDIGVGRRGFRNRNLGLGQAGTIVDAEWANGIQEEIIRAIEVAGLTPAASNREQLIQAIRRLAGATVTGISITTTLTADMAGLLTVSAASSNVTLTLPAANVANGAPLRFRIVRTDDISGNTLTIQRAGADTIAGLFSNLALPTGASVDLVSDGASRWRVAGAAGLSDFRALTASGTTAQAVPAWATRLQVEVWGAGGGGGGCSTAGAGMGGGGGEYRRGMFVVIPGASLSCTVGAAGAAGTAAPTSGGVGGTSSVGAFISAAGGAGGSGSGGGIATGGGGGGTGGSGGQFARPGAVAQLAYLIGGSYVNSIGGATFGAGYGATTLSGAGNDGYAAGVGGNGGANGAVPGGGGGNGLILLTFLP